MDRYAPEGSSPAPRGTPRLLLLLAGACGIAFGVVLAVAYWTGAGRFADSAALEGFVSFQGPLFKSVVEPIPHLADPIPYGLLAGVIVAVGVARGRLDLALALGAMFAGSAVSSQVLKALLAKPRPEEFLGRGQIAAEAFPSGHATAAMALALGAVVVAPLAWRELTALLAGSTALVVSLSIVALGWHFPSDVLGGFLLATIWCLVPLAAVRALPSRALALRSWDWRAGEPDHHGGAPGRPRRELAPWIMPATLAAIAGTGVGAGIARGDAVASYAERHTAAVLAAFALAALAATLVAGVAVAHRGR